MVISLTLRRRESQAITKTVAARLEIPQKTPEVSQTGSNDSDMFGRSTNLEDYKIVLDEFDVKKREICLPPGV